VEAVPIFCFDAADDWVICKFLGNFMAKRDWCEKSIFGTFVINTLWDFACRLPGLSIDILAISQLEIFDCERNKIESLRLLPIYAQYSSSERDCRCSMGSDDQNTNSALPKAEGCQIALQHCH
jgi:hypothetical protein